MALVEINLWSPKPLNYNRCSLNVLIWAKMAEKYKHIMLTWEILIFKFNKTQFINVLRKSQYRRLFVHLGQDPDPKNLPSSALSEHFLHIFVTM